MYSDKLRYTRTHEWVMVEGDTIIMGITEYAAKELSDIVFVELPFPGKQVEKGSPVVAIESVKTVSDMYAPVDGEVTAVNEEIAENPEKIVQDIYGAGWFVKIKMNDPGQLNELLNAGQYEAELGGEGN